MKSMYSRELRFPIPTLEFTSSDRKIEKHIEINRLLQSYPDQIDSAGVEVLTPADEHCSFPCSDAYDKLPNTSGRLTETDNLGSICHISS